MKNFYGNLGLLLFLFAVSMAIVLYRPINLGLDLRGGISMIIQPEVSYALEQEYQRLSKDVYQKLKEEGIPVLDVIAEKSHIRIELLERKDVENIIGKHFPRLEVKKKEENSLFVGLREQEVTQLRDGVINQTVEVLRKRIDELGVVQPVITKIGQDRVLVELPGVLDLQRAKSIVGKTALLELKLVLESGRREDLEKKITAELELLPSQDPSEWFLVERSAVITGADLKTAYTSQDEFGRPAVSFELTDRGANKFGEATEKNIGRRLAIVLDKRVISAPVIRSRITNMGQITGQFTLDDVKELAIVLRAGALPTKIDFLQESVIGPTLGRDAIEQGIKAGILGYILLALLLVFRYKTSGITANLSIVLNALMLWAGMVLLGATLTLPGIAGIILNMGIAVDSNVLIFERVKEEIKLGNSIRKAIDFGYRRTLSAVFDTHVTLLVAALILFQFGSGPVKGFATTLTLGTIASFVSNVYFAKFLLELLYKIRLFRV